MIPIDGSVLSDIAPDVYGAKGAHQAGIIAAVGEALPATLARYAIDSRLRAAHFLAQIAHESDGFCTTEEYASGGAYEGRKDLGNKNQGDGRLFKGRGLLQLTGRANYKTYGKAMRLDLEANPALAGLPANSLTIACEFWTRNKLNAFADRDDLLAITRRINGGTNGVESRRAYLTKAKAALARLEAGGIATPKSGRQPALRRGSRGEDVERLQTKLRDAGYPIAIDADFGAATELAVMHLQNDKGQTANGIAGPGVWKALG